MIDVVATKKGYYGGKIRAIGDRFRVASEGELSATWMARKGTDEYDTTVSGRTTGISRTQIDQERAEAGGLAEQLAISQAEVRTLKERVAELEAMVAVYADRAGAEIKPVEPPVPAEGNTADDGSVEGVKNGTTPRRRRQK